MLHRLLEEYIPSESYVIFLKELGREFTEFETAAILHQIELPPEEKIKVYKEFLNEAHCEELRNQLLEEITREENILRTFKMGGDKIAYHVQLHRSEWDDLGFAANYETAYKIGMRQDEDFVIRKYRLWDELPETPPVSKGFLNPFMLGSSELKECITLQEVGFANDIGSFIFRRGGTLVYAYSSEIREEADDNAEVERIYSPKRFTNAFIDYPYPFERGDIVRYVGYRGETSGGYGIVNVSPTDWADFLERVKGGLYVDQSDASVTVDWLQEDGNFCHSHNPPIFLERAEPDKDAPEYELIEAASSMFKGGCGLDWFTDCYESYKKKKAK